MPRPKRSKIAPFAPATRNAKLVSKQKVTKGEIEDIDNSEGDAINSVQVKKGNGTITIETAGESSRRVRRTVKMNLGQAAALDESRKKRDAAIARLETENFPSGGSSEHAVVLDEELSSSPSVEAGRREIATPAAGNPYLLNRDLKSARQSSFLGRANRIARSSSVESSLAEDNGLTNVPRARNSWLGQADFRRQTQTPIQRQAISRVRSSSMGLEMDIGSPGNANSAVRAGMFKRRARQPSILGTAKKERRTRESDYGGDDGFNDEDDFDPEDESTPLNRSKTRSTIGQESQTSSTINPRKRKLSPMKAPPSPPRLESQERETFLSTSESPALKSEQPVRPSTPEPLSETMAPPQSSSPGHATPEVEPSRRINVQSSVRSSRRQAGRRALSPPPINDLPSSPPSLTHSPNGPAIGPKRQAEAAPKPKPQPAAFSTVELQALLPRRRRRPNRDLYDVSSDEGEVDVDELGSDEDELSYLTSRTNRAGRQSVPPRPVARLKPGSKLKGKNTAQGSATKTYGARRTASDKENSPEHDYEDGEELDLDDSLAPLADSSAPENSVVLEERVGKELTRAKRKFEVVDKWELEFEEVTGSSSSPWDAR